MRSRARQGRRNMMSGVALSWRRLRSRLTWRLLLLAGLATLVAAGFALSTQSHADGVAPSFTSANATTFTVGQAGSFEVDAAGSPTPFISEAGALPAGVRFQDNGNGTATLSGTPP